MASGIKIDDKCKETYQQICITKQNVQKYTFMVLTITDDLKKVEVERCGTAQDAQEIGGYEKLIASLPDNDVRYVCYDFEYINKDNCRKSDIILVSWHPDKATVRRKMVHASSFGAVKAALGHIRNILEGDCLDEINAKAALEKVGGKAVPT